jgi:hypothetical protein
MADPELFETEWEVLAIRCLECRAAAFTPSAAAAEAFLTRHMEHPNRLEYVAKITAPPEMAGRICTLAFGQAGPG